MSSTNSTIAYYDRIADDYDRIMSEDDANQQVRSRVGEFFVGRVPHGRILDFGAGTGLDLEWQLESGYQVIFYEPSAKMAARAQNRFGLVEHNRVLPIVGEHATIEGLEKVSDNSLEGVFSNFAALNSVSDLKSTFSTFSRKLKESGHLVCVLTHNFEFSDRFKAFIRNRTGQNENRVSKSVKLIDGQSMEVFYHSLGELERVAKDSGLLFKEHVPLKFEKHVLSHFVKNPIDR